MPVSANTLIHVTDLAKVFRLHSNRAQIPVFESLSLEVNAGECVVLAGASGTGKSTLMRAIYGNYLPSRGSVSIRHEGSRVDLANLPPRQILEIRRHTLGYVSQFLRVIPRVNTLDLVMEPLLEIGVEQRIAERRAMELLKQLNLSEAHWHLPPATFSGGEQQRVNIARGFITRHPILLLDEPTASLDADNRGIVIELIREALTAGTAMVGIFHDEDVRDAVATRLFDVSDYAAAA